MSPNQRSRKQLESEGWLVDTVERRITSTITRDLFGIFDLLCVRDGVTLAVQCTSESNVSSRRKKVQASDALPRVLAAGWQVEVHGWGVRKGNYFQRVHRIEAPAEKTSQIANIQTQVEAVAMLG